MTLVADAGDNSEWVSSILRASALAIIVFQIGYIVLDGGEYPQTLARTLPLHIASITLGLVAIMATLSPRAMRSWRAIALAICSSILAITAWIGVINSDGDVLVASILLSFLGSGALIPWSPRWQAAFNVSGALALLWYSMETADPNSRLAVAWIMLVSAALLSQLSTVHGARYRRNLAHQLAALAESHRLLRREMDLRAKTASALERDHEQLHASESMLLSAREELSRQVKALTASEGTFRKLFDANLDAVALTAPDGTYIDVNREFVRSSGYSREETIGHHFSELNQFVHPDEMIAFAYQLAKTSEVRNLEVAIRRKDGSEHPVLISAANLELQGQLCRLTISREISDLKMT